MKRLAISIFLACYGTLLSFAQDITTGLIAHYTFEGNTSDQSGRNNHAALAGSTQYAASGLVGQGVRLLGDNSLIYNGGGHINFPQFGASMNSGFTVSLWVRDEVLGGYPVEEESYISFGVGDTPNFGISINAARKHILFYANNGPGAPSYDIFRALNWPTELATWKHLVLTYTPGKVAAYYNGTKMGEGAVTVNAFPTVRAALGRHWWGPSGASSARMTALYDNVRVYSRALSETDVRQLNLTDPILVTAAASPTIVTPPAAQTVAPGQSVTFNAVAAGSGLLSFQWRKNDQPISGANSTSFTIPSVAVSDAGSYALTVSNQLGAVTSLAAILTVQAPPISSRFVNVSTRGTAGSGDAAMIAGFNIRGDLPVRVLIRGIGPTLAAFGVSGTLIDPKLTVFRGNQQIGANDDWSTAGVAEIAAASLSVGAFALNPGSRDAALILTLQPGAYTVNVSGPVGVGGSVLVEVYEMP